MTRNQRHDDESVAVVLKACMPAPAADQCTDAEVVAGKSAAANPSTMFNPASYPGGGFPSDACLTCTSMRILNSHGTNLFTWGHHNTPTEEEQKAALDACGPASLVWVVALVLAVCICAIFTVACLLRPSTRALLQKKKKAEHGASDENTAVLEQSVEEPATTGSGEAASLLASPVAHAVAAATPAERLKELKALLDQGLVSETGTDSAADLPCLATRCC